MKKCVCDDHQHRDLICEHCFCRVMEGNIYDCLATGGATKATLEWTFAYQRVAGSPATRPSSYTYKASFDAGCDVIEQRFENPGAGPEVAANSTLLAGSG